MNSKLLGRIKLITFIFIVILFSEVSYVIYSLCFKNTVNLYFDSINAVDNNSSYYVTVGSNNDNDNYFEKAKITKYDKKKNKEFEKLFNVGYNSAFFGVKIDEDSIITVGSYEKNDSDHNDAVRRALIVKYDISGEEIFEKDYKLLDNSRFTNIVVVDDGYIVCGQSVYGSTKIGNKDGGAILVKYDNNGKMIWNKFFGNNKNSSFNDLIIYNNYIYVVGVESYNTGVICKYDMNGNLISNSTFDNTDSVGFTDIVIINDRLYVTGSNDNNAMILEYDLDCKYIKSVMYKDNGNSRFNKIIKDNNDNIVVIGTIEKNKKSNNKTADNFNYDGVIGKYNNELEKISIVTYGDDSDDYFTDIKFVDNSYLVVGYSSYEDGSYLSKFIRYSDALKVLEVE